MKSMTVACIKTHGFSVLLASIGAGTVSTLAQMLLWSIQGDAVIQSLLRDARFAAAIVMGRGVLPPPVFRSAYHGCSRDRACITLLRLLRHYGVCDPQTCCIGEHRYRIALRAPALCHQPIWIYGNFSVVHRKSWLDHPCSPFGVWKYGGDNLLEVHTNAAGTGTIACNALRS